MEREFWMDVAELCNLDNDVLLEKYYGLFEPDKRQQKRQNCRTYRQQRELHVLNRASGASKKNQKHGCEKSCHIVWDHICRQKKLREAMNRDDRYWEETHCVVESHAESFIDELYEEYQHLMLMEREFREHSAKIAYEKECLQKLEFDMTLTKCNIGRILSKLKAENES